MPLPAVSWSESNTRRISWKLRPVVAGSAWVKCRPRKSKCHGHCCTSVLFLRLQWRFVVLFFFKLHPQSMLSLRSLSGPTMKTARTGMGRPSFPISVRSSIPRRTARLRSASHTTGKDTCAPLRASTSGSHSSTALTVSQLKPQTYNTVKKKRVGPKKQRSPLI